MVNALTRKAGLSLGPIIFETLLKHYFDRIAKDHESEESTRLRREELLYDEAFNIVKVRLYALPVSLFRVPPSPGRAFKVGSRHKKHIFPTNASRASRSHREAASHSPSPGGRALTFANEHPPEQWQHACWRNRTGGYETKSQWTMLTRFLQSFMEAATK